MVVEGGGGGGEWCNMMVRWRDSDVLNSGVVSDNNSNIGGSRWRWSSDGGSNHIDRGAVMMVATMEQWWWRRRQQ